VELLVVVAVVLVLASLFFSSLARARSATRSVVCKNNLKQQGLALSMYVGDFHRYPLSQDYRLEPEAVLAGPQVVTLGAWTKLLKPYVTVNRRNALVPRAFFCPEIESVAVPAVRTPAKKDDPAATRTVQVNGFYGYNGYGTGLNRPGLSLGLGPEWDPAAEIPVKETDESLVRYPSEMLAIADSLGVSSLVSPVIGRPGMGELRILFPAKRHSSGANATYCDGHVEFARQRDLIETTPQARRRWNIDFEPHPETW
jgi:prepilin-type processing-associated H-X9-DG protein